ncbi:GGDEF domain-containing protein [Arsenicicoccus dermatophilus]|uniref:GGDEF domain-containing protein n=1 Tax=Arsenicicoccus dermatophilus TaxID=1076331 RepID=UPI003916D9A3
MTGERDVVFRWAMRAGAVLLVAYLWSPPEVRTILLGLGGLLMPGSVLVGMRLHRPAKSAVWICLVVCGVVWGTTVPQLSSLERPVAGPATIHDLVVALGYTVLIGGLIGSSRRLTNDRTPQLAVDLMIFAIGAFSVVWSFAVGTGAPAGVPVASLSSPLFDLLALMAATRLLAVAGGSAASTLLVAGLGVMGAGDVGGLLVKVHDPGSAPVSVGGVLFLAAYLLVGAAALHPSMTRINNSSTTNATDLERVHLLSLSIAAVLPPAMLVREHSHATTEAAGPLLVASVAAFVLVIVRIERMKSVVELQRVQLQSLARTDHLTSLPNRRTGEAEMGRMLDEAVVQGSPLVAALLDLDHFKDYNDRHGHPAGDRLLEAMASAWRRSLPPDVFLSRHGGEEFLLLAKGRHPENVRLLLEGLRGASTTGQTFSAGAAVWDGVETLVSLLQRADTALYAAKDGGRDQVRFARTEPVMLTTDRWGARAS